MKKLFPLVLLTAGAVMANAQSFTDSFDTAVFGGGANAAGNTVGGDDVVSVVTWRALNLSTPIGTSGWFNNPSAVPTHTGAGALMANFNNVAGANTINNWCFSPVRTFNNGDTISFWTRTVDIVSFPDRLFLTLGTNGASTNTADYTTNLVSINPGLTVAGYPSVYTQFSATISGLAGATSGRFAFNYNVTGGGPSGANSDFIAIDDVVYTANAVPEPATMATLALGGLALLRRRNKKA